MSYSRNSEKGSGQERRQEKRAERAGQGGWSFAGWVRSLDLFLQVAAQQRRSMAFLSGHLSAQGGLYQR